MQALWKMFVTEVKEVYETQYFRWELNQLKILNKKHCKTKKKKLADYFQPIMFPFYNHVILLPYDIWQSYILRYFFLGLVIGLILAMIWHSIQ